MTQPAATVDPATEPSGDPSPFTIPDNLRSSIAPSLLATLPDSQRPPAPAVETASKAEDPNPEPLAETPPADGATQPSSPDDQLEDWVTQLDENPATLSRIPRANQVEVISEWKTRFEEAAVGAVRTAYEQGQRDAQVRLQMTAQVGQLDELLDSGDIPAFREAVAKFPGGEKNYYRVKAELQPIAADSPERFQAEADSLFRQLDAYPEVQQRFASSWNYTADAAGIRQLSIDIGKALGRLEAGEQDPAAQALARRKAATAERRATPRPDATDGSADGSMQLNRATIKGMTPQQLMKYSTQQLAEAMKR